MIPGFLQPLAAGVIGLGTGVLSGFFGVGGGVVMTPAIRLILDTSPLIAVGTTLSVTLPSALSGGLRYSRQGLVDFRVSGWAAVAGIPASIVGSFATTYVHGAILMVILALVVAAVGLDFVSGARERRLLKARKGVEAAIAAAEAAAEQAGRGGVPHRAVDNRAQGTEGSSGSKPKWLITGGFVGFVSGFLGIGGGVLAVPIFLSWLQMPVKKAFGTSLIMVALLATPGSIVHFLLGHVDVPLALMLALGVVPGAWVGAGLASRASDRRLIRAFGFFLLAVALVFGYQEVRRIVG